MTSFYALPVVMPAGSGEGEFAYNGLRGLGEAEPKHQSSLVEALEESGFVAKGAVLGGLLGLAYALVKEKNLGITLLGGIAGGVVAKAIYTPKGA